jgi:hypothetical protein
MSLQFLFALAMTNVCSRTTATSGGKNALPREGGYGSRLSLLWGSRTGRVLAMSFPRLQLVLNGFPKGGQVTKHRLEDLELPCSLVLLSAWQTATEARVMQT